MLLDYYGKECVILNKTTQNSPEGGYITSWNECAHFTNYQALDTSTEAQIAEKQGLTALYNVLVEKSVPLAYGDYYRDIETQTTYRVTSEPSEVQAPASSSLNLKRYSAEKAVLP